MGVPGHERRRVWALSAVLATPALIWLVPLDAAPTGPVSAPVALAASAAPAFGAVAAQDVPTTQPSPPTYSAPSYAPPSYSPPSFSAPSVSPPSYSPPSLSAPSVSPPSYSPPSLSTPSVSVPSYAPPAQTEPSHSEPQHSEPQHSEPSFSVPSHSDQSAPSVGNPGLPTSTSPLPTLVAPRTSLDRPRPTLSRPYPSAATTSQRPVPDQLHAFRPPGDRSHHPNPGAPPHPTSSLPPPPDHSPPPQAPPPPPGTITTTSAAAPASITVPPLVGKGLYVAESVLATHGLATGEVIIDRDSRGVAGTISKSVPRAGDVVPPNHPIDLYVIPPG